MTGVGGRPEVIIEGSNNPDTGAWKVVKHNIILYVFWFFTKFVLIQEYDFLYKPGDLYTTPTYVGILCFVLLSMPTTMSFMLRSVETVAIAPLV